MAPSRLLEPELPHLTPLDKLTNPLGGQDIELQQLEFEAGGMPLLRVRIREGKRFTIFDLDPATALRWADAMAAWARAQAGPGTRE